MTLTLPDDSVARSLHREPSVLNSAAVSQHVECHEVLCSCNPVPLYTHVFLGLTACPCPCSVPASWQYKEILPNTFWELFPRVQHGSLLFFQVVGKAKMCWPTRIQASNYSSPQPFLLGPSSAAATNQSSIKFPLFPGCPSRRKKARTKKHSSCIDFVSADGLNVKNPAQCYT